MGNHHGSGWRRTFSLLWKTFPEWLGLCGCYDKDVCASGGSCVDSSKRRLARIVSEASTYTRCRRKRVVVLRELLFSQLHDPKVWWDGHKLGLYDRSAAVLDFSVEKGNAYVRLNRKLATFIIKYKNLQCGTCWRGTYCQPEGGNGCLLLPYYVQPPKQELPQWTQAFGISLETHSFWIMRDAWVLSIPS